MNTTRSILPGLLLSVLPAYLVAAPRRLRHSRADRPGWHTFHLAACTQQSSQELIGQPFAWRFTLKKQCKSR